MASVQKHVTRAGTLYWKTIWRENGLNGKGRQRSKNFTRERDALAFKARMETEVEGRDIGDPLRQTTGQFLHGWINRIADRGEHSPTTVAGYRRAIEMVCRHPIRDILLADTSGRDCDDLYVILRKRGGRARRNSNGRTDARPLTGRTVLHVHRVLHAAFEQARRWKFIAVNPVKDATAPTAEKSRVRAFTSDEVTRLLDAAQARDPEIYLMAAMLLITGIRRSELLAIAFDAIDFDTKMIAITRTLVEVNHIGILRQSTKTDASYRELPVPDVLIALLREQKKRVLERALLWGHGYRRQPLFVFPGEGGEPLLPQRVTDLLRAVMLKAKVHARSPVHGWRHTCATTLLHAGNNVKVIQQRLGHTTPAITMALYAHSTEAADRAAADQLGDLLSRPKQ